MTTQLLKRTIHLLLIFIGLGVGIFLAGQIALASEMLPGGYERMLVAEATSPPFVTYPPPRSPTTPSVSPSPSPAPIPLPPTPLPSPSPSPLPIPNPSAKPSPAKTPSAFLRQVGAKYGHLPYVQAPAESLVVVGQYGGRSERLAVEAADAFVQMTQAARHQGVYLIPISGFRTLSIQTELFRSQTARRGSPAAAARVSAPPGYSEHHTGYAIDLGDRNAPGTDVETSFAATSAFRWMQKNASSYGFELSFSPNNPQGVIYEPWHWRFVGSPQAKVIFDRAKQLQRLSAGQL